MSEKVETVFGVLSKIDISKHIRQKKGLTYLNWASAWAQVKANYPESTYEVAKFNNLPYVIDPITGIIVYTKVTINEVTHEMWLPVLNGANKAMKTVYYEYQTKYGNKSVQPVSMFDINKAIMRCLVKNIAMHGLGLSLYTNEDMIDLEIDDKTERSKTNKLNPLLEKLKGKVSEEESKPVKKKKEETDGSKWIMKYPALKKMAREKGYNTLGKIRTLVKECDFDAQKLMDRLEGTNV